jgi:hypothetical protein
MLMTKERRPAIRTLRRAISVLQDAGAIRECEERRWMQDGADQHARVRALAIAHQAGRRLSGSGGRRGSGRARLYRRHLPDCPPE